ncbi:MAG: hypothetical protein KA163_09425 [Bacteroidia bacterium]|nr:hypothetical protein [Bacteroidia bacterium]
MANKINIENYEAFLLDYMEGNLSTEDFVSLQMFAAQHPHLNIDLNDLELVELETEKIHFNQKENLKKPLVSEEQFVAYIENELSTKEKQNLEAICISNDALAKELRLYKSTIVSADANIVFEKKNSLKKQETKVLWLFSREVLAAAASLILIAGLWFMFKTFTPLGTETLNSEKIKGNSTIKTFAIRSNGSTPSYTVEKANDSFANTNQVAYSNTKINKENKVEEPKEIKTLIATNTKENIPNTPKEIITDIKPDNITNNTTTKFATTTVSNTQSYIITEKAFDEDEKVLASNEKKGFWNKAMNALNSLNKLGVKKAKGTETVESNNEQYVLTMGNFKVENHKYNAE